MSKRILITSYFLPPEATPRAFRAAELAREMARRGHEVTVYAPSVGTDRREVARKLGVTIHETASGFLLNRGAKRRAAPSGPARAHGGRRRLLGRVRDYVYPGGSSFECFAPLARALRRDRIRYDVIISVGLPFGVHVGTALGLAGKKRGAVAIADYGDPFSYRENATPYRFHAAAERATLRFFDHVTVPVAEALPCFERLVPADRVHVVPQGYDLEAIEPMPHTPGDRVRFAYAGIFYPGLRDPRVLFEQLAHEETPFEFVLYTDTTHSQNMSLIDPFRERLGSRLDVRHALPREECIRSLGEFDFLVNQENMSGSQVPSKLIDYALAGRPVFGFRQDRLDADALRRFLHRDYSSAVPPVDLTRHDIRRVTDALEALS